LAVGEDSNIAVALSTKVGETCENGTTARQIHKNPETAQEHASKGVGNTSQVVRNHAGRICFSNLRSKRSTPGKCMQVHNAMAS